MKSNLGARLQAIYLLLAVTLLTSVGYAAESAPDAMVKSTVDEVLTVIKQNKDKRALRHLAEQKVLPHFDFKHMTQLAVGTAWRQASSST